MYSYIKRVVRDRHIYNIVLENKEFFKKVLD